MTETEEQALRRINQPFIDLEKYTHALIQNYIRGLLVIGEPGLGKSHNVNAVLTQYVAANKKFSSSFEVIKGSISPPYVYQKLHEFRQEGNILVFDDCEIDGVDSLNLLKSALDSCDKREIAWYKHSSFLKQNGLPSKFEYNGGIIYLTNSDLMKTSGKKSDHMAAIISRCHYIDMRLPNILDKIRRIRYIVYSCDMLTQYGLTRREMDEIVRYIELGAPEMRELSLRVIKKIADLYIAYPNEWRQLADRGCKMVVKHV